MRITGVRPGDIVRAGHMHALVIDRQPRVLIVKGLCNGSMRRLRADEVEAHWRAARPQAHPAPGSLPKIPQSIFNLENDVA